MKLGPDPLGRGSIWATDVAPHDAVATHEREEPDVGYVDDLKYATNVVSATTERLR